MSSGEVLSEMPFGMTHEEERFFAAHLSRGGPYLEFGAGGSTLMAIQSAISLCVTVESDPAWLSRVAEHPSIAAARESGRYRPVPIDVGPVGLYGRPTDRSAVDQWPTYWSRCWNEFTTPPELVLIDGRFRVACALAVLAQVPVTTRILFHDFNNRPEYHVVLEYAECVERCGKFAHLARPQTLDLRAVYSKIDEYRENPG